MTTIRNSTAYGLWVYLMGPISRVIQLGPSMSQNVPLAAGRYQEGARVSNPMVIPFYGVQNYGYGTAYDETFYIGARP